MAPESRVVRVFVSSTFRDMQEERDYLVKHIFPELRRRCRQRQVEFVEVDLRWGVTEEQANRGEVLPICLREIELCRPYFIGLLAERYGWVPEAIPPELIEEQPWLAQHRERSLTALEIIHGVLQNPEMASRAYFYFRDPAYLDRIPPERRGDFAAEDATAQKNLTTLKDRIRHSGLPLWEDYPHPQALGELILEDLWCAIDQEYPVGEVPDPLDRDATEHEAFAASRAKVYIGRQEYYERLDRHADSEDQPLVILGESGVGKSALLANWAQQYRQKHSKAFIFIHFIGTTPQSTDYVALLHRLFSELKRRFPEQLTEDVPAQADKLREALPIWLAGAASHAEKAGGRVILVLDALNQLEDKDNAPDLGWLPDYFPPRVRVLVSTLPGRPLTALTKRGWLAFEVEKLRPEERHRVITDYLEIYRRTPEPWMVAEMIAAPQAGNPLYLRALLEEMRLYGIFEELRNRLRHYLIAPDPPALYGLIMERLEKDYEKPRPGLVADALSCIWAARRGLLESELLELLGTPDGPLPRAFWSPLSLALEDSLISRSGQLTFYHDYLRQAVQERYLPAPEAQRAAHLRLADYFKNQKELTKRKLEELPWQFAQAGLIDDLQKVLTDLEIFLGLSFSNRYEIWQYWQTMPLVKRSLAGAYRNALEDWKKTVGETERFELALNELEHLLCVSGERDESGRLTRVAYHLAQKLYLEGDIRLAIRTNNLATALYYEGKFSDAASLLLKILPVYESYFELYQEDRWIPSIGLGLCFKRLDRLEEAENVAKSAVASTRQHLGPLHESTLTAILNLAKIIQCRGRLSEATPLFEEAACGRKTILGIDNPMTKEALIHLNQHLSEFVYEDVSTALINLALQLQTLGIKNEAIRRYREALNILEKESSQNDAGIVLCIRNLTILLEDIGDSEAAHHFAARLVGRDHKLSKHWFPKTAIGCNNLGLFYRNYGRLDFAEPLLRQALNLDEHSQKSNSAKIPHRMNNLSTVLIMRGKFDEAKKLLAHAWQLKSGQHDLTSTRLLFVRLTAALLESQPSTKFIGQLKTLVGPGYLPDDADVVKVWDITYFIEHLRPQLLPGFVELLVFLADAINDRRQLFKLDQFELWKSQAAIALEIQWPEK